MSIFHLPSPDGRSCVTRACGERSELLSDGTCRRCGERQQRIIVERGTGRYQCVDLFCDRGTELVPGDFNTEPFCRTVIPTCSYREILVANRCQLCGDYELPNRDKTRCIRPLCNFNQVLERDGSCRTCAAGTVPDSQQLNCNANIQCSCTTKLQDGRCQACPVGQV